MIIPLCDGFSYSNWMFISSHAGGDLSIVNTSQVLMSMHAL